MHYPSGASNALLYFPEPRLWIVSVLPMVRQIVFCFGAKKMLLLYKEIREGISRLVRRSKRET